jgi:hypothetical protein
LPSETHIWVDTTHFWVYLSSIAPPFGALGEQMQPRTKRRILLAVLVAAAATALLLPERAKGEASCPPGDRADWHFEPTWPKADRITWVVYGRESFERMCPAGWYGGSVAACAMVYPDPIYGGHYCVVRAMVPKEWLPESLQAHESCHCLGWNHGKNYF